MIRIGDFRFKYSIQGQTGPLCVLLHGYGGSPLDWHQVVPFLSENYRLLIPNLTPLFSCPQNVSFSKQIEVLATLINAINGAREPFFLIGTSFGGTLSFGLRAHFQSLVLGHFLVNPMPLSPIQSLRHTHLRMLCGMNMVPGALPLFLKTHMGKNLLLETGRVFGFINGHRRGLNDLSPRKLEIIGKALQRFAWIVQHEDWNFWQDQLRDHVIPTFILTGGADTLFDERDYRQYQQLVPKSEHAAIEDAGHLLVRTHAQHLSEHLRAFMTSADARLQPAVRPAI